MDSLAHYSSGGSTTALIMLDASEHGAIVIPTDIAAKIREAAELCGRRETPILEIARSPDFTLEKLEEALKCSSEVH